MSKAVETYRGIEIKRFEDVFGFYPYSKAHTYTFVTRYRREDDAPIASFAETIESARDEIDWELGDVIVDLRPANLLDAVRARRPSLHRIGE